MPNPADNLAAQLTEKDIEIINLKLQHMAGEMGKLVIAVENVNRTLQILAKLEEGHQSVVVRLREGSERFKDHEERLGEIEQQIPGLKELRKWVVIGVMSGAGMILAALLKLVIIDPVNAAQQQQVLMNQVIQRSIDAALQQQQQAQPHQPPAPHNP